MGFPRLGLLFPVVALFIFQGCGLQEATERDLASEASSFQGEDLKDGYVEIGDMLVHRSDVAEDDLQKYWPHEYENQQIVNSLGIHQGVSAKSQSLRLWVHGVVPVQFSSSFSSSERNQFMAYWDEFSNFADITFVQRTNESDYVYVVRQSGGCGGSSYIGRTRGRQTLTLRTSCSSRSMKKVVQHEMMHALGVLHEQSRPDRDAHVDIHWNNISSSVEKNFAKVSNPHRITQEYDFDSIMHYSSSTFGSSSRPTITRKVPYQCQGSNDPYHSSCRNSSQTTWIAHSYTMSAHDREILILLYGSASGSAPTPAPSPTPSNPAPTNPAPAPTTPTPAPTTPPQSNIRGDIQIYVNDAQVRFNSVMSNSPNGTTVYFRSDETRTSTAYAYGTGENRGDNLFNWGMNRYYYIYCEDKDPSGNSNSYYNRCVSGLTVHTSVRSSSNISLEFHKDGVVYSASPRSFAQAASTLLTFLENEYGAANFNDDERSLLFSEAAAVISQPSAPQPAPAPTTPAPAPTNPAPAPTTPAPAPTNPAPVPPTSNDVRQNIQIYFNGVRSRAASLQSNQPTGALVYFKTDETSDRNTVSYGGTRGKGDNQFNQAVNRIYYAYCEAKTPKNNDAQFYNRCIDGVQVYTQVVSSRRFMIRVQMGRSSSSFTYSSMSGSFLRFLGFLEQKFGASGLTDAERDLLKNL